MNDTQIDRLTGPNGESLLHYSAVLGKCGAISTLCPPRLRGERQEQPWHDTFLLRMLEQRELSP